MAVKIGGSADKKKAPAGDGPVDAKGRYTIHSDKPLPDYDLPPAKAFSVTHKRDKSRSLLALICDPSIPPRLETVGVLHRVDHRNFMRAIDWDVVYWPPDGRYYPAIIYEAPLGKRVFSSLTDKQEALSEEHVIRSVMEPVVQILREMHAVGVIHGAIRPDNLFYDSSDNSEILLGQCSSMPAHIRQPVAYCTIPFGQCHPAGRGRGNTTDDMYALGVTILGLLAGRSPGQGYEDEQALMRAKLGYGSYAALVQRSRISSTFMEPLRGLLNDEETERWTLDELSLWLNGRRLSPKQQSLPTKASRSLKVAGEELAMGREVAYALAQHWDQAGPVIQEGALDTWLRRSLSDEDRVEAVNVAKGVSTDSGQDSLDKLIARVLIALEPERPIQLREFSATVDGVCQLLATNAGDSHIRTLFNKILTMGLIPFWMEMQVKNDPEHVRIFQKLEKAKAAIGQTRFGSGIEKLVYEMNSSTPCRSQLFEKDYVPNLDYVLPALDRVAATMGAEVDYLVDRQLAAYLTVHFKRSIGDSLRDIDVADPPYIARIAQVQILSKVQESNSPKAKFPDLCNAAAVLLQPAIERFHSRETRERIDKQLRKASKSGRLRDLIDVIDNQNEVSTDNAGFEKACQDYARYVHQQLKVFREMRDRKRISFNLGGQISSALAGMLGVLLVFITSLVNLF